MYQDRYGGRSSGGFNDRQQAPPVKEGEEIDVTIEAVGEKGDGIAKQKGFVLFVPGTKAGERVRIRITKVLAKVGFAQSIGPALTQAGEEPKRVQKKEPEFEANEEMDSEDFGDEMPEEPEKEE